MDETGVLWNECKEDENARSECGEGKGTDCEDRDSDAD